RVAAALPDAGRLRAAVHEHPETAYRLLGPALLAHLCAARVDPGDVLHVELGVVLGGEKSVAPQDGVGMAQLRQPLHEAEEAVSALADVPVEPIDLIVL